MSPESFCYWCQGFFELSGESVTTLDENQVQILKNHLNLVFFHSIDPKAGGPEVQAQLNQIHNQGKVNIHAIADNLPPIVDKPTPHSFPPVTPTHLAEQGILLRC